MFSLNDVNSVQQDEQTLTAVLADAVVLVEPIGIEPMTS